MYGKVKFIGNNVIYISVASFQYHLLYAASQYGILVTASQDKIYLVLNSAKF
jgi:hypothetical protein